MAPQARHFGKMYGPIGKVSGWRFLISRGPLGTFLREPACQQGRGYWAHAIGERQVLSDLPDAAAV